MLGNWRVWYLGLVFALMATSMNAIIFWGPLIIDAALNGDEALAAAAAKTAGVLRIAETNTHHDQRVRRVASLRRIRGFSASNARGC